MAWAWYLLSQNPQARGRKEREVDEMLGGREATVDDLSKLQYTG